MELCTRRLQTILKLLKYYNTNATEIPRITVPQKMIQNIEKRKLKQEIENRRKKINFKSPRIISCKKPEFNHHKGQTYSEFKPTVLASHGWKGRKSAGDYFTINSYQRNPALQADDMNKQQFTDVQIRKEFLHILERMNITCPTVIQSLAIPKLLDGESIQLAAETGSGKTLAYLLPIMELIARDKENETEHDTVLENCPRCIVLVPTKELVEQIKDVADQFAAEMNFSVELLLGGIGTKKKMTYPKRSNMDILISTTGMAKKFLSARIIKPSQLQYLVLDEADTLLDDSFNSEVKSIINKLGVSQEIAPTSHSSAGMQIICVSATMPRSMKDILGDQFPIDTIEKVTTNHLHYLMPHVPQKFMKLKPSQKPEEIILLSKNFEKKGIPAMIFCNEHATSVWLSRFLGEHSIKNTLMNAQMTPWERKNIFERFQNEESDILVCTDVASRGLDTIRVQHVVNYEFPNFMSDYIHRAGRVGRVGSHNPGQVTSYVTYKWEVDLLWHIETSARRSSELHNVNANIKRKLTSRAEIKDYMQQN